MVKDLATSFNRCTLIILYTDLFRKIIRLSDNKIFSHEKPIKLMIIFSNTSILKHCNNRIFYFYMKNNSVPENRNYGILIWIHIIIICLICWMKPQLRNITLYRLRNFESCQTIVIIALTIILSKRHFWLSTKHSISLPFILIKTCTFTNNSIHELIINWVKQRPWLLCIFWTISLLSNLLNIRFE